MDLQWLAKLINFFKWQRFYFAPLHQCFHNLDHIWCGLDLVQFLSFTFGHSCRIFRSDFIQVITGKGVHSAGNLGKYFRTLSLRVIIWKVWKMKNSFNRALNLVSLIIVWFELGRQEWLVILTIISVHMLKFLILLTFD